MARSARDRVGRPPVPRRAARRRGRAPARPAAGRGLPRGHHQRPRARARACRSSTPASRSGAASTCSRTTSAAGPARPDRPAGPGAPRRPTGRPCSRSTRRRSTSSGGSTSSGSTRPPARRRARTCGSPVVNAVAGYGLFGRAERTGYVQRLAIHPGAQGAGLGLGAAQRRTALDAVARRAERVRQHAGRQRARAAPLRAGRLPDDCRSGCACSGGAVTAALAPAAPALGAARRFSPPSCRLSCSPVRRRPPRRSRDHRDPYDRADDDAPAGDGPREHVTDDDPDHHHRPAQHRPVHDRAAPATAHHDHHHHTGPGAHAGRARREPRLRSRRGSRRRASR